jgi:signal transduction histidine kinase
MDGVSDELAKLISDVRHDTNNSLMAILGYVELLLTRDDLPESAQSKLRHIEAESYKIRDSIARTKTIRRPDAS